MKQKTPLIRTLVVDDERPSRDSLIAYIREYCKSLDVVASCKSVKEAYTGIIQYNPGLVFLDIEMPKGNAFDLLNKLHKIDFSIIFVTAFSEYATRAFRFSATDYLLKPVKVSELVEAVSRVKEKLDSGSSLNIRTLLDNFNLPDHNNKKLVIPNQKGFDAINTADIIICEADGYCTTFSIRGGRKITSAHNLRYYEELLPEKTFLRVHNSFIINLSHVTGYSNQGMIYMCDSLSVPLSKNNKAFFINLCNKRVF